ncbi:MAG: DUF559 domain-containing protein [Actinobacteria bacterium]|nr:DUF559 domain-containing protein [Actinomycetota bacterium]
MRRSDLGRPFHGVRTRPDDDDKDEEDEDPYSRQARERLNRIRACAPRLREGQFLCKESAAALWQAPLPLAVKDGIAVRGDLLPVHVGAFGTAPLMRTAGVIGHRARVETTSIRLLDGIPVASPTSTWASLGTLPLIDLVALGDYFCRVWREGPGRPDAGRPPLATRDQFRLAIGSGRRVGIVRLREAVELIREDSWSPRESALRCVIVFAGLPEPALNYDVYDARGRFLGCVDLAYPERRIAIEYHGILHHARYARDVERIAALRAAGWTVIEVTAALFADEGELLRRIRRALRG